MLLRDRGERSDGRYRKLQTDRIWNVSRAQAHRSQEEKREREKEIEGEEEDESEDVIRGCGLLEGIDASVSLIPARSLRFTALPLEEGGGGGAVCRTDAGSSPHRRHQFTLRCHARN